MSSPQSPDEPAEQTGAVAGEGAPAELKPKSEATPAPAPQGERPARKPARAKRAKADTKETAPRGASKPNSVPPASKPAAPPAPAPGQVRHEGHGVLWAGVVAFITIAAGVAAALWYWQGAVRVMIEHAAAERAAAEQKMASDISRDLSSLEARIADLERRASEVPDLSAIKDTEAATAVLGEKTEGLTVRMGALEKKVAALEEASGPSGVAAAEEAKRAAAQLGNEVADLKERLAAQEQQAAAARGPALRRQALVLAVGQLREAIAAGRPFRQELDSLAAVGAEDEDVIAAARPLESLAGKGVPTLGDLRARFPKVADAVVHAGDGAPAGRWIDTALERVAQVVTVRRTGPDVQGTTPDAIVARAEAKLDAGDLKAALAELDALPDAPKAAAADWIADARARLAAEEALAALQRHVIGEIAQGGGSER
jgi:hypothetical protein